MRVHRVPSGIPASGRSPSRAAGRLRYEFANGGQAELASILDVYEADNYSRWDCDPDGNFVRRRPGPGEKPLGAQDVFIAMAGAGAGPGKATRSRRARKE